MVLFFELPLVLLRGAPVLFSRKIQSEEMGCTSKNISKVENGASALSLPFVINFSEITGSDLNYLLRGMYPKGESTAMLVREPAPIYELSAGLSKKSRKICSEVMTKIIEVLEENNI